MPFVDSASLPRIRLRFFWRPFERPVSQSSEIAMKIRSRLLNRIAVWFVVRLMRILFFTCRVDVQSGGKYVDPFQHQPDGYEFAYCLWHDAIVLISFAGRQKKRPAVLISRHRDGTYLADAVSECGFVPIRGSSSRGGAAATRKMMDAAHGLNMCVTPDGPRGPRRRMKSGIVFLASRLQKPLVAVAAEASRAWRINASWTDMVVPKPFSRILITTSAPVQIPADLSREQLADWTARIQVEMDRVNDDALRQIRGESRETLPDVRSAA